MARAVVLGNLAPDEPFPFAWYASVASARKRFGHLPVYADQLPYGYWWDRIRDGVTVVREGEPPPGVERLPLGTVWRPDGTQVREGEPGWDDALALFREDPDQHPAINKNGGGNARRVVEHVARQLADAQARARPLPAATPQIEHRRLCVGMATYDDFDGAWATIQALRYYQPDVLDQVNFLVVDNHPEGPAAEHLKAFDTKIPRLRYVPFTGYRSTAARDLVFREANADIVLCVDSHVLLQPGAVEAVIDWFDRHPESLDLLQGPLAGDEFEVYGTQFDPKWNDGMFGQWGHDERGDDLEGEPFEIGMQGLGVFACRRDAWVGINPRFRGFGGEEGYLQEKFRRAGGRVLCHPALRWHHRFARPSGIPYVNIYEDRVRNYLIGWRELGWDPAPIAEHFREHLGEKSAAIILTQSQRQLASPFDVFDGIFCLNLDRDVERWEQMTKRFAQLDIGWRVERFPAIHTPENHHIGVALSFRNMIEQADHRGYENVLIFEDDVIFLDETAHVLRTAVAELPDQRWDLLYLGAATWGQQFTFAPGSTALQIPHGATCTHAIAVHRGAFAQLLEEIPAGDDPRFADWIETHKAVDQYLPRRVADGAFDALIVSPRVATQPYLRTAADADGALADRYVI